MGSSRSAVVFFAAMAFLLESSALVSADVEGVRASHDAQRTRIVFDLTQESGYSLFRLDKPERVVIDLEEGGVLLSEPDLALFVDMPVRGFRYGVQEGGVLRLVLDLRREGLAVNDFVLGPNLEAGRGYRLVVDLSDPSDDPQVTKIVSASVIADSSGPMGSNAKSSVAISDDLSTGSTTSVMTTSSQTAASPESRSYAQMSSSPHHRPPRSSGGGFPVDEPRSTVDFSGTWWHEWAWVTDASESQKFESIIQPRWDVNFGNGVDLTAMLRIRADGVGDLGPSERKPPNYSDIAASWYNSAHAELSLREFYIDFQLGNSDWRLGKQQVVWGAADGIKVLDVVNPQSWREFILDDWDDSRIPLWTANVTVPVGDSASLQLLWIPDTTYHEFPEVGSPFEFTSRRIIPQVPITALKDADKPDNPFSDSDLGFALSSFVGGWDLSLNYLYHYLDAPILPVRIRGPQWLQLEPEYGRSHLLGGSFSNAFGNLTFRGEIAYNTDSFQPTNTLVDGAVAGSAELSAVVGLDWAANIDTLVSAQFFNSYLFDHVDEMGRDEQEQMLTLLYQQDFANAAWRFRGIGIYSVNDGDSQLQLRLSYWVSSELQAWIGADAFGGDDTGLFGQYENNDRVLVGFEYGF